MIEKIQELINNYRSLLINNEETLIGGGPSEDYNESIKKIINDLELLINNVLAIKVEDNSFEQQLNDIQSIINENFSEIKQKEYLEEKKKAIDEQTAEDAKLEEERQNKILEEAYAEVEEKERQEQQRLAEESTKEAAKLEEEKQAAKLEEEEERLATEESNGYECQ